MIGFLRAFRGALVIAVLWAIPWTIVGSIASPLMRKFANALPPTSLMDYLRDGLLIGWYGFLAGLAFSLVLAFAARRRTLEQLTWRQMAQWGLVSSVLLTAPPMVLMLLNRTDGWRPGDPFYLGGSLILSAGCAVASLLLARRGAPTVRESVLVDGQRAELGDGSVDWADLVPSTDSPGHEGVPSARRRRG